MNIGLCDDDIIDRNFIKICLDKYAQANHVEIELQEYEHGEALIQDLPNHKFDVFLLDIYMHNMTGIEVAQAIREQDKDVLIVFITSSKEYAMEGYRVHASDYLLKPISYERICETMGWIAKNLKIDSKTIEILSNRIRMKVKVSTIMYAEVFNTVCVLHTTQEEYRTYITLDELCGLLEDDRFIRCHRSFLVNMDYVDRIEEHNFVLKDMTMIPIGRKNCSDVKKTYYSYRFKE